MSPNNTGLQLYIRDRAFHDTTFPDVESWDISRLVEGQRFGVRYISAAPPGGHSLSDCERYEAIWRANVTAVVSALKGEERACLVWVYGPIESDGLLLVMQYVDYWIDRKTSYHFEGFTKHRGPGYYSTWLTFEFDPEVFATMMKDDRLYLELLPISMMFCDDAQVEGLLERPFYKVGVQWILEHNALALSSPRHFEGCYIFGLQDTVDEAIERVRPLCVR